MISKEAAEAAANLTISQIRKLLDMVKLVKLVTPELVTPELIQREVELHQILTLKLEPQTPTPELIEKIKNIQQTQQETTKFTNATDIARKYL